MDEVTNVENFFKSHQVHLCRAWLESCINWCKEENLQANYTLKDLQFNVFEQWLLLDLREVEVSCLPPNLSSQKKYTLDANFTLQLMQIVDISKPKYWQLNRIRMGIAKNLEQEFETSKRVLQLTLTDGVQEIEAIEYKPIKSLHLNLPPGIKIRLISPIQVRRGRLMLEEGHVKVLGGEVDTLLVSNAAENILAKHLNQPLNPKPEGIQESLLIAENNMNETGISSVIVNNRTQNNQNIDRNNPLGQNIININTTDNQTKKTHQADNLDQFDEELRIEEEIELLMEVEKEFEQSKIINKHEKTQSTTRNRTKTPDLFEDMDVDFESIEIPDTVAKPSVSKNQQNITSFLDKPKESNKKVDNSKVINLADSFESVSEEKQNAHSPEKSLVTPQTIIWSVDKLLKIIPNVTNSKFKIKAKFKSVINKMTVTDEGFHMVVEVGDDTGNIVLKIHNDVVSELIGITATVFMGFRDEISKNNPDVQRKAIEALKSLQTRLSTLDNVLEVLVNVDENFAILVKIL